MVRGEKLSTETVLGAEKDDRLLCLGHAGVAALDRPRMVALLRNVIGDGRELLLYLLKLCS